MMNYNSYEKLFKRLSFRVALSLRTLMPAPVLCAFGQNLSDQQPKIEKIYIINLDRQTKRWKRVYAELRRLRCNSKKPLTSIVLRFSAIDAKIDQSYIPGEIESSYTLSEQLFVEPEPLLKKSAAYENQIIAMTRQEIAVARSHIEVWKLIAASDHEFGLVLEDDVYFTRNNHLSIDRVWLDLFKQIGSDFSFDMLYLSYRDLGPDTEKLWVSEVLFRPIRGLWQMSGYVLSRAGAEKLLSLLPVRGPVDLWINYQFEKLNIFASAKPLILQRPDAGSDNEYSILPALSRAGVLSEEKPNIFPHKNLLGPVFVWTTKSLRGTLPMALSMLGYRCCANTSALSAEETEALKNGKSTRIFNVYVNIDSLDALLPLIVTKYPAARFLFIDENKDNLSLRSKQFDELGVNQSKILKLFESELGNWNEICNFLSCERPDSPFPSEIYCASNLFTPTKVSSLRPPLRSQKLLKYDYSPWIIPNASGCSEIETKPNQPDFPIVLDTLYELNSNLWRALTDTFPSNIALFDPRNLSLSNQGARLTFRREAAIVRDYTSASLCSVQSYLYGRFEAVLKPAKCPGLITGIFLHRYFPRQEIDIEILGKDTTKLLINVYYNPGLDGFDCNYGYRGTPILIDLGFDASEDFHSYAIEWEADSIKWLVDGRLIHKRTTWNPTPIPHLPMQFYVNLWSSRSEELVGKLANNMLPAHSDFKSLSLPALLK